MKQKVIILGGMTHNIPHQLSEYFDVVRQYQQDEVNIRGTVPQTDLVFVIRNWVSHKQINTLKLQRPSAPMIWLNKGWNSMREELERRNMIPKVALTVPESLQEYDEDQPEPEIDPLEKMTDEELEKLTRPEPPSVDVAALWVVRMDEWADRWAARAEVPVAQILKHFSVKDRRYTLEHTLLSFPSVERGVITKMIIGFCKMRSSFDTDPTKPLSNRKWPNEPREKVAAHHPQILSDDVTAILVNAQKLVDKRNGLLAQIETLKEEVVKVDKDLEAARPLMLAVENMKKAAAQIKANAEKEVAAKMVAR